MKLILIGTLLLLTACGGHIPRPAGFQEDARPLLERIERRGAAVKSISGELKTEIWQKLKRVKVKQLVAADPQGRLRIEVLSPFGHPVTTLVSDGSRLMIYLAEEKRFLLGAATTENMARLLPIPLSPGELGGALRGAMPLIPHRDSRVEWNGKDGRYRLILSSDERRQLVDLEPKHLRVTAIRTYAGDTLLYRAEFGDYSGTGDAVLPRRIRFEVPSESLKVDMSVVEHRVNPELPDAAFHLVPPRGIRVEAL